MSNVYLAGLVAGLAAGGIAVALWNEIRVYLRMARHARGCSCEHRFFPDAVDADCPEHGLRSLADSWRTP